MYIQLIGLGGLLKTPSIKIRRVLCLAIANSYDAEQDAFIINGRPCRITLEDVAHITGMPCHGKNVTTGFPGINFPENDPHAHQPQDYY